MLADKSGVSRDTVIRIEHGDPSVKRETIGDVLAILEKGAAGDSPGLLRRLLGTPEGKEARLSEDELDAEEIDDLSYLVRRARYKGDVSQEVVDSDPTTAYLVERQRRITAEEALREMQLYAERIANIASQHFSSADEDRTASNDAAGGGEDRRKTSG